MRTFRRARRLAASGLVGAVLLAQGAAAAAVAAASGRSSAALDWTQYLHGPQHSSVSLATAFTPSNAASATVVWRWPPAGQQAPVLDASPTVAAGRVYIGSEEGELYALSESSGAVVWRRMLDVAPKAVCKPLRGITSTAAVLPDPVTGTSTVYVSGARYLYALNAATGTVVWKTEIGPSSAPQDSYYNYSSPTVAGGHIYVGLSGQCDRPLIRGGVVELDQHTGKILSTWYSEPAGSIGGSVWSSVAATSGGSDVWVSTGNECEPLPGYPCPPGNQIGYSLSIVHLSSSLAFLQAWQVPNATGHDWDFGSSPTLFGGSGGGTPPDVGACNKNGKYYALTASPLGSAPLWADTVGAPGSNLSSCLASAVWDGQAGGMYLGGDNTTIGGTSYGGSVRKVDPATGRVIWQTGMPCAVMGTPSLDSAGVLAAGTYSCPGSAKPGAYLLNAATGAVLTALPVGASPVFGQPVFAQGTLFVTTQSGGLFDLAP